MGSALGLQFHLEVTGGLLEQWLQEPAMIKGLKKSQIAQIRQDFADADSQIKVFADSVFSGFAARCLTYARSLE
jgi:hypothetical protein